MKIISLLLAFVLLVPVTGLASDYTLHDWGAMPDRRRLIIARGALIGALLRDMPSPASVTAERLVQAVSSTYDEVPPDRRRTTKLGDAFFAALIYHCTRR
jgi:hypothetical protein